MYFVVTPSKKFRGFLCHAETRQTDNNIVSLPGACWRHSRDSRRSVLQGMRNVIDRLVWGNRCISLINNTATCVWRSSGAV